MTNLTDALAAIAAHVPKDQRNAFAGYDYASADAIYAHVRPALLAAGYLPYQTEVAFEMIDRNGKAWVQVTYEMALRKADGSYQDDPERVTVLVQVTGAQSMAAVRTYAMKYWLRGKVLLATGDMSEDIDAEPKAAPGPGPGPRPGPPPGSTMRAYDSPEPSPNGTMKEIRRRAKQHRETPWDQGRIDALAQALAQYGADKGLNPEDIDKSLATRYGSSNPAEWTDAQRDAALSRLQKAAE